MADWPVEKLGGKTLLQYAKTPHFDYIARNGQCGMLKTVAEGFHPGSEVANSSILGYDQHIVYEGRGPLEAASIGVDLEPGDLAMRCNLVCIKNGILKNHSCGRLETHEADQLIEILNNKLGSKDVHFYTGVQYRHLLVIKDGDKRLDCVPPHDIPGKPYAEYMLKANCDEAEKTASLLRYLVLRSQEILPETHLNQTRAMAGQDMASSIWPWGGGYKPKMQTLAERFPKQIKQGAVITAVDLIRGIGKYAGLDVIEVEGATGLYDTNFEGKAKAAINALKEYDFVYVHVEASDEAGHDGNLELKLQCIRDLDERLVKPILDYIEGQEEPIAISILPDHPTPVALRTHTAEPIPFAIYHRYIDADKVQHFDEDACKYGIFGNLEGDEFINAFMNC